MSHPAEAGSIGLRQFDFDVHTGSKIELHQRVYGLWRGLHNVEQPFVSPDFELLARLLVDVRSAVHGELFDTGRKWNGTAGERAGAACGFSDIAGSLIEDAMVKCFQADANILRFHGFTNFQILSISKSENSHSDLPIGSRSSCL